jgi:hypothetical protein
MHVTDRGSLFIAGSSPTHSWNLKWYVDSLKIHSLPFTDVCSQPAAHMLSFWILDLAASRQLPRRPHDSVDPFLRYTACCKVSALCCQELLSGLCAENSKFRPEHSRLAHASIRASQRYHKCFPDARSPIYSRRFVDRTSPSRQLPRRPTLPWMYF